MATALSLHRLHYALRTSHFVHRPAVFCAAGDLPGDLPGGFTVQTRIGAVRLYIDAHPGDVVDLDRLAERAHLSKYHFARRFREETGTTPWAYVRAARLRRAKILLERTDLPLSEVALRAGFYDQSHLNRAFKEAEGTTPGAYREERRQEREDRKDVQDGREAGA